LTRVIRHANFKTLLNGDICGSGLNVDVTRMLPSPTGSCLSRPGGRGGSARARKVDGRKLSLH